MPTKRSIPRDAVADVPSSDLKFEGCVDAVSAEFATGWCWFPDRPDLVAQLRVRAGGVITAPVPADLYRKDLADSGKRGGACRFDIPLLSFWAGGADSLRVELVDGRPLANGATEIPEVPRPLNGANGFIERFGPTRIKGWITPATAGSPARLSICEGDTVLFTFDAADWRTDLEDSNLGDGRGGFDVAVPAVLCDGHPHQIDLRLEGSSLLTEPLRVYFDKPSSPRRSLKQRLTQTADAVTGAIVNTLTPLDFSFVVNFYNMRREAERTLTSLTRAYQRGAEDIRYEVICVDNGSNPPLDEAWIKSFGPEFRLVRPSRILPSPCFALNEAARQAKGRHLAIMIDGAHILSPGVLREAKAAIDEDRNAIVALRQWFVNGDQRWLNVAGYTRENEDVLFARARWPSDGYNLFEISAPMNDSSNDWFDGIQESNCLILPAEAWREIGGFDEAFSIPGGGFCNLDLLRRAADSHRPVTVLLGEATFHQYHEGTTTNVDDREKDTRVRTYANTYRDLRGKEFAPLRIGNFKMRGSIDRAKTYALRQRPLFNAPFGVTTRVRPGTLDRRIDGGSISYLNGAYVEAGLQDLVTWRGERVFLAPGDLMALQDILNTVRPQRVVITAREPALARFVLDMARIIGIEDMRIVCVTDDAPPDPESYIDYVSGPPYVPTTLEGVRAKVGDAETVLVLFSRREDDFFPVEGLRAYAQFVSFQSYMVVLRTTLGQPWLGYSKYRLKRAVDLMLPDSGFVIDETCTRPLVSMCSGGFLARVKPPLPRADDEALEHLAS